MRGLGVLMENAMNLVKQQVPAEAVLRMINARLEAVTMAYQYAKGCDRKIEAEAMVETKCKRPATPP